MALHLFPWTGRQVHVGSMTRHLYVRRDHERERPGAGRKSTQTQAGEGDTDSEVCGFCSGEPAAPVLSPRLGTCRHRHGRMHGDQMEPQLLALLFLPSPPRGHISACTSELAFPIHAMACLHGTAGLRPPELLLLLRRPSKNKGMQHDGGTERGIKSGAPELVRETPRQGYIPSSIWPASFPFLGDLGVFAAHDGETDPLGQSAGATTEPSRSVPRKREKERKTDCIL